MRIFILFSVRLCVSVIFLHVSQASMALVSTWLLDCQVKKSKYATGDMRIS